MVHFVGAGPGARTLALVAASLCFFFVNLSVIYYYVQTTQDKVSLVRSLSDCSL